jgi:hypothetical protein
MHDWAYLKPRLALVPRHVVLDIAVRLSHSIAGNIVEFGVADGESTRAIQAALVECERGQSEGRRKQIFGCDSFKGLPEPFERLEIGAFACAPPQIPGVEIVEGYFQDTLTPDLARRVGPVSFAFLDADLYSSTLCALRWLTPLVGTGSLLLFDEFLGEKESEKRAFEDWSRETEIATVRIAEFVRNPSGYSDWPMDKRMLFQVVGAAERARVQ